MTHREQKLLRVLLVIGGVVVPLAVLYLFVVEPYFGYQGELADLQEEVEGNNLLITQRVKEKQQLERWRLLSLPPAEKRGKDDKTKNYGKAEIEYRKFLSGLLKQCDLREEKYVPPKTEVPTTAPNGKKLPRHVIMPFTLILHGKLASLVAFLEQMDRAPYIHRVKSLQLSTKESKNAEDLKQLTINITIEAVVVARSERHVNLLGKMLAVDAVAGLQRGPIGLAVVPWAVSPVGPLAAAPKTGGRYYADMLARNFFVGGKKEVPPEVVVKKKLVKPPPKDPGPDLRKYYTLVQINHTNIPNPKVKANEAHLNNDKMKESKYVTLREHDRFMYLRGKYARVLRIGHREFYFQDVDTKDLYVIGMQETIADAVAQALTPAQIERLGLDGKKQSAQRD